MARNSSPSKSLLYVQFWDHCEDMESPMECEAAGIILESAKDYYLIACWDLIGECSQESRKSNWKVYTILKSTIIAKKVFKV